MSLFRIKEVEEGKPNKLRKVNSLKHALSSSPTSLIPTSLFSKSLKQLDNTKQGDGARDAMERMFTRTALKSAGQMGDSKLPTWHYLMEQTFESFLLKLDDIFLSLRKDDSHEAGSPSTEGYKDICEKLRTEILIAMDRLEFLVMPAKDLAEEQSIFLNKLNGLKYQLSDLRWQYHNAIKDLGTKIS